MLEIYQYSDYRKFIRDYHTLQKKSRSSFSYRYISEKAGLNSSGFYPLVVQGKRNLTDRMILQTAKAMELDDDEAEYFEALVHFNQAKSLKAKNKAFETLIELQNRQKRPEVKESQFDFFAEWYHCVIRELVVTYDFEGDYKKLGNMVKPALTAKQARESIEILMRLGFLKLEKGKFIQSTPIMSSPSDIKSHQVKNFQVKMLNLAIEAYDRFGKEEQISNSSTVFRISEETYEKFRVYNRDYRKKLMDLAEEDGGADQVYQLNINMFPLSNPKIKQKKLK